MRHVLHSSPVQPRRRCCVSFLFTNCALVTALIRYFDGRRGGVEIDYFHENNKFVAVQSTAAVVHRRLAPRPLVRSHPAVLRPRFRRPPAPPPTDVWNVRVGYVRCLLRSTLASPSKSHRQRSADRCRQIARDTRTDVGRVPGGPPRPPRWISLSSSSLCFSSSFSLLDEQQVTK